ncbi:MAG: FadR family transcriptional regulator [Planctomycetaceae bacterium]|nr:FadR family transcriptional regulator [Planctomycetaceae bacterium]
MTTTKKLKSTSRSPQPRQKSSSAVERPLKRTTRAKAPDASVAAGKEDSGRRVLEKSDTEKRFAVITKPRMQDQIAEQIRGLIIAERLQPGDRLPTETEMAERFGVSRLTVREATKALEFLGILRSKTGVGLTVGELDWQKMTHNLGFHASLHQVDADELIDSRVIVETGIIPYVMRRIEQEPQILVRLQDLVAQLRDATDLQTRVEVDLQFHRTLLEASGLAPMIAFGEMLQVFFQKFRDSVKKAGWEEAVASHQRIVDSLKSQKPAKAIAELKQHIENHRRKSKA